MDLQLKLSVKDRTNVYNSACQFIMLYQKSRRETKDETSHQSIKKKKIYLCKLDN